MPAKPMQASVSSSSSSPPSFRDRHKRVIAVTTCTPPSSSSSSSSSLSSAIGPAVMLCPHTGSVVSNSALKVNSQYGILSLVPISSSAALVGHNNNNSNLYLAYVIGKTKDDTHAALLVGGGGVSASSSIKWKCRVPEYLSGKLTVSYCGRYVVGGGESGRCYIWNILGLGTAAYDDDDGPSSSSSSAAAAAALGMRQGGGGGELLAVWTAHHRPVTCLLFAGLDGGYVITGGDDGVVNAYSLLDLVDLGTGYYSNNNNNNKNGGMEELVEPKHTWSEHHLPISSLCCIPASDRIVSISLDRLVIIHELYDGSTLAKISLPSGLTSIACGDVTSGQRLYVGSTDGIVYCIDLDVYASKQTAESATIVSASDPNRERTRRRRKLLLNRVQGNDGSERILGTHFRSAEGNTSYQSYVTELRGQHGGQPVTSLAVFETGGEDVCNPNNDLGGNDVFLVSGGRDGTIRIWDIQRRCPIRVVAPWSVTIPTGSSTSTSTSSTTTSKPSSHHPISSIVVLTRSGASGSVGTLSGGMFGGVQRGKSGKNEGDITNLIRPLQRFSTRQRLVGNQNTDEEEITMGNVVPLMKSCADGEMLRFRENEGEDCGNRHVGYTGLSKRRRLVESLSYPSFGGIQTSSSIGGNSQENANPSTSIEENQTNDVGFQGEEVQEEQKSEIVRLQKELEEAKATIARWEKVNNKLAAKLKKATSNSGSKK